MFKNNYTEDEFKKMVKNLLTERKQDDHVENDVDLLKKQLEKVKPALKKLVEELKETKTQLESFKPLEQQNQQLLTQIQELNKQIDSQKVDNETLVKDVASLALHKTELSRLEHALDDEKKRVGFLEHEIKVVTQKFAEKEKMLALEEGKHSNYEQERSRLFERLADSVTHTQRLSDQIRDLQMEVHQLSDSKKSLENEFEHLKLKFSQSQLECTQLERSLEKTTFEQKENENLRKKIQLLEEEEMRLKQTCQAFSKEIEKKENDYESLKKRFDEIENTSDLPAIKQQFEEKLAAIQEGAKAKESLILTEKQREIEELKMALQAGEIFQRQEKERAIDEERKVRAELVLAREEFARQISDKEKSQEEILAQSYGKLRELFEKNAHILEENHTLKEALQQKQEQMAKREQEIESLESLVQTSKSKGQEKELEIRKAQAHLAKKVKENTMLRDVLEKQKNQLVDQQNQMVAQKNEIEKLKSTLQLQRIHEEKLEAMAKERAVTAENLSKEWQDKYFALHLEWQEAKTQVSELLKMKKHYEQLQSTFTNVKGFLSKSFELPAREESSNKKMPSSYDEDFFET